MQARDEASVKKNLSQLSDSNVRFPSATSEYRSLARRSMTFFRQQKSSSREENNTIIDQANSRATACGWAILFVCGVKDMKVMEIDRSQKSEKGKKCHHNGSK
jgi:hypothetical protein